MKLLRSKGTLRLSSFFPSYFLRLYLLFKHFKHHHELFIINLFIYLFHLILRAPGSAAFARRTPPSLPAPSYRRLFAFFNFINSRAYHLGASLLLFSDKRFHWSGHLHIPGGRRRRRAAREGMQRQTLRPRSLLFPVRRQLILCRQDARCGFQIYGGNRRVWFLGRSTR